ncbi:alpha-L-rhamnosidase-related protein [Microlunatus endophyticus]
MPQTVPDCRVDPILLKTDPFAGHDPSWSHRACWPARWISVPDAAAPVVAGYRLAVSCDEATHGIVHVSADERFELYVDGALVGRGPERGDPEHWAFHSFSVDLEPGDHWIAARVWSLGEEAPYAQLSVGHGFLLAGTDFSGGLVDSALDTGSADWQATVLPGYATRTKGDAWGCGAKLVSDGRQIPWGWVTGQDTAGRTDWTRPHVGDVGYSLAWVNDMPPGRMLVPATLPPQREQLAPAGRVRHLAAHSPGVSTHDVPVRAADSRPEELAGWQRLLGGDSMIIPPHSCWRALIDLETYTCAFPLVGVRGGAGAAVRVHWQESLYAPDGSGKGNRNEIEGKIFGRPGLDQDGPGDLFIAGGGDEQHSTLWWEAGRYVEVLVTTADEPLELTSLEFLATHYPYDDTTAFSSSDPRLAGIADLALRTLQMCSHETTMDCPYYEQLQYAGDTRLQCLVAYATCDDDQLARQALVAFDRSRSIDGLTRSRTPSRIVQRIPPFSLWWVAMVHDFALWRGDLEFVADLMPGVRAVLDAHRRNVDQDGVFHALDGWNFTDWVDGWDAGAPPGAQWDVSGVLQLQLINVLRLAAELETWLEEPELAARSTRLADRLSAVVDPLFYDDKSGLYADDASKITFSEHVQALAVLAGAAHGEAALRTMINPGRTLPLARTSVYFDHYLFEALRQIDRTDVVLDRFGLWFDQLDHGLTTVVEQPEPTRSDCHAWGAHPRFHLIASLLGVRPTSPGMRTVSVVPRLGGLDWAEEASPLRTVRSGSGPLRAASCRWRLRRASAWPSVLCVSAQIRVPGDVLIHLRRAATMPTGTTPSRSVSMILPRSRG